MTTAVQFFESIYSNRSSKCRKLHNIANSVIIFDEAQMIPGCHLKPCVGAIVSLVKRFNATAILCTATQPVLQDIAQSFDRNIKTTEICKRVDEAYEQLNRVTYKNIGKHTFADIADMLCGERQVLCIVNTRKAAQKVFELLPQEGSFHLSTLMYSKHRKRVLDIIRQRLENGLACRVVSTSLIEAGVDVDFPSVYREMAGLDSLTQAAGRCNREGKRSADKSIVSYFESEATVPPLQCVNVGAAREALSDGGSPGEVETIRRYFTAWRSLNRDNLDKSGVVSHMKAQMQFAYVAEHFRLIDRNTKIVYIPINEAEQACKRIKEGCADRNDYRLCGQYGVNVYEEHYKKLIEAGDIQPIDDDTGILVNMRIYDDQTGLSLKADFGRSDFI